MERQHVYRVRQCLLCNYRCERDFALSGDYACTAGQQVYMVAWRKPRGGAAVPLSTTAATSPKRTTITVASTTGITTGLAVTGTGIAAGATVTAVNTGTKVVTLSRKNSSNGTNVSVTFSTTTGTFANGGYTITVVSWSASPPGIRRRHRVGGTVTAVNGKTVTLSQQNTADGYRRVCHFHGSALNNPYLIQMVGLGQCPALETWRPRIRIVDVDEITTVAFAYVMAGLCQG